MKLKLLLTSLILLPGLYLTEVAAQEPEREKTDQAKVEEAGKADQGEQTPPDKQAEKPGKKINAHL